MPDRVVPTLEVVGVAGDSVRAGGGNSSLLTVWSWVAIGSAG